MKKYFLLSILGIILFHSCKKESKGFILSGKISGYTNDYLYLDLGKGQIDSCFVANGVFTFQGKLQQPVSTIFFTSAPTSADNRNLYLENSKIAVKLSMEKRILGNGTSIDWISIEEVTGSKSDSLYMVHQTLKERRIDNKEALLLDNLYSVLSNYPNSVLSSALLFDASLNTKFKKNELKKLYDLIEWDSQDTVLNKRIRLNIFEQEKIEIGNKIIDFELFDEHNVAVSSNGFRGKYFLLDFWASWCKPCREEFPQLKKTYQQYKSERFEIIGISIDDSKEKWIQALEKDSLPWINLIAKNGHESKVAWDYNVLAIPKNYLIDTKGTIIAENLTPEQLSDWLEKNAL